MKKYLVIPETNNLEPLKIKVKGSLRVAAGLFNMLATIQFHHQLAFKANKIHNVWGNRMLATELEAPEIPILQLQPKRNFSFGCRPSELSG